MSAFGGGIPNPGIPGIVTTERRAGNVATPGPARDHTGRRRRRRLPAALAIGAAGDRARKSRNSLAAAGAAGASGDEGGVESRRRSRRCGLPVLPGRRGGFRTPPPPQQPERGATAGGVPGVATETAATTQYRRTWCAGTPGGRHHQRNTEQQPPVREALTTRTPAAPQAPAAPASGTASKPPPAGTPGTAAPGVGTWQTRRRRDAGTPTGGAASQKHRHPQADLGSRQQAPVDQLLLDAIASAELRQPG